MRSRVAAVLSAFVLLALALLTGCTSSGSQNTTSAPTGPLTALPGDGGTGQPSPTEAPTPSGSKTGGNQQTEIPSPTATPTLSTAPGEAAETDGECPYLSAKEAEDMEGNRVGRTTVIATTPPGCRFYFAYDLTRRTVEITTRTFADAIDANNAMVELALGGKNAAPAAGIGDGAVLFQTTFYPPDGDNNWACAFIKGTVLYLIKTSQTEQASFNAKRIAETVASRL